MAGLTEGQPTAMSD